LPACPNCGTAVASPTKVFTVIVEPKEGERGLTQRKVGMYQCGKCETRFPTVISRQHYLVVAEDQMTKVQTGLSDLKKTNQDLEKRIEAMGRQQADFERMIERTKKEADTRVLEAKVQALERHVAYLRKEKGELEEKTTKPR
jgi:predicted RNase H-like nuclease (RuvC/YqgF family)